MTKEEALAWIGRLAGDGRPDSYGSDRRKFTAWVYEAETLFARVLLPSEPLLSRFKSAIEAYLRIDHHSGNQRGHAAGVVHGVFDACKSVLENAPSTDLFWHRHVADSDELLDQAEAIVTAGWSLAAAAVLAGGALEQHLLHLCTRYSIPWTGRPSIATYNNAIRSVRSQQAVPFEEIDAKQVDAWGAVRNDAAHKPGSFSHDESAVRRLIAGVRDFLARVS